MRVLVQLILSILSFIIVLVRINKEAGKIKSIIIDWHQYNENYIVHSKSDNLVIVNIILH